MNERTVKYNVRVVKQESMPPQRKCPMCGKRALDVIVKPSVPCKVQMKCPHCHQIVDITVAS